VDGEVDRLRKKLRERRSRGCCRIWDRWRGARIPRPECRQSANIIAFRAIGHPQVFRAREARPYRNLAPAIAPSQCWFLLNSLVKSVVAIVRVVHHTGGAGFYGRYGSAVQIWDKPAPTGCWGSKYFIKDIDMDKIPGILLHQIGAHKIPLRRLLGYNVGRYNTVLTPP
jgi:hypothetical protein